ncbi:unnamed protein product, partial [Ilex paraguariensis]
SILSQVTSGCHWVLTAVDAEEGDADEGGAGLVGSGTLGTSVDGEGTTSSHLGSGLGRLGARH